MEGDYMTIEISDSALYELSFRLAQDLYEKRLVRPLVYDAALAAAIQDIVKGYLDERPTGQTRS